MTGNRRIDRAGNHRITLTLTEPWPCREVVPGKSDSAIVEFEPDMSHVIGDKIWQSRCRVRAHMPRRQHRAGPVDEKCYGQAGRTGCVVECDGPCVGDRRGEVGKSLAERSLVTPQRQRRQIRISKNFLVGERQVQPLATRVELRLVVVMR